MRCNITSVHLRPEEREAHFRESLQKKGIVDSEILRSLGLYESVVLQCKGEETDDKKLAQLEEILEFISRTKSRVAAGTYIEDPENCYCALPLTAVKDKLKAVKGALAGLYSKLIDHTAGVESFQQALIGQGYDVESEDPVKAELEKVKALGRLIGLTFGNGNIDTLSFVANIEKEIEELWEDHQKIKGYLQDAGKRIYNPAEAPFNPTKKLVGTPQDIYDIDRLMVLASMFFEFSNYAATTGAGMEEQTAVDFNKFPFVLTKKGRYVTRMSTGARGIVLLEYDDVDSIKEPFVEFVRAVSRFRPGTGTCSEHGNSLIGFENGRGSPVCMHGLAKELLPGMEYDFAAYTK